MRTEKKICPVCHGTRWRAKVPVTETWDIDKDGSIFIVGRDSADDAIEKTPWVCKNCGYVYRRDKDPNKEDEA